MQRSTVSPTDYAQFFLRRPFRKGPPRQIISSSAQLFNHAEKFFMEEDLENLVNGFKNSPQKVNAVYEPSTSVVKTVVEKLSRMTAISTP